MSTDPPPANRPAPEPGAVVVVTNVEDHDPWDPLVPFGMVAGLVVEAVPFGDREVVGAWGLARLHVPERGCAMVGDDCDPVLVEYCCVLPTGTGQHAHLARGLYPELIGLHVASATLTGHDLGRGFDILTASSIAADFDLTPNVVDAWQPAILRDLQDRWQTRRPDLPPGRGDIVDLADLGQEPRRVMWARHHLCSYARWDQTLLGSEGLIAASNGGDAQAEGHLARLLLRDSLAAALVAALRIGALSWDCVDLDALVAHLFDTGHRSVRTSTDWPANGFAEPADTFGARRPLVRGADTVEPHGPFTGFPGMPMPDWYREQFRHQPLVAVASGGDATGASVRPDRRQLSVVSVLTGPAGRHTPALVASWSIVRLDLPPGQDQGPVRIDDLQTMEVDWLCVHPHSDRQAHDMAWALAAQLADVQTAGDWLAGYDLQRVFDTVATSAMRDPSTVDRRQLRAWHDLDPASQPPNVLVARRRWANRPALDTSRDLGPGASAGGPLVFDLRHDMPTRSWRPQGGLQRLAASYGLRSAAADDVTGLVARAVAGEAAAQRQLNHDTLRDGLAVALLAARALEEVTWDQLDLDILLADLQRHGRLTLRHTTDPLVPVLTRPELAPPPPSPHGASAGQEQR